jgi:hypothetical protein
MNKILFILLLGFNSFIYAQNDQGFPVLKGDYLGQTLPGDTPVVFAPDIVSTSHLEHSAPSFSPDGNEVYWKQHRRTGVGDQMVGFVMVMRRNDGIWSAPYIAPFDGVPVFSPDGLRAYFSSRKPHAGATQKSPPDADIWFVERQGDGWSEPRCLGIGSNHPEVKVYSISLVTRNGTIYYEGDGLYRMRSINGEYVAPERIDLSIKLRGADKWTYFVAPDESYVLFSSLPDKSTPPSTSNTSDDHDPYGDIYIAKKLANDMWADPVSLSESVNSPVQERFPMVSPDGKYIFFTRWIRNLDDDIFWVSTANIPALNQKTTSLEEK